jgi:hypothetical protein
LNDKTKSFHWRSVLLRKKTPNVAVNCSNALDHRSIWMSMVCGTAGSRKTASLGMHRACIHIFFLLSHNIFFVLSHLCFFPCIGRTLGPCQDGYQLISFLVDGNLMIIVPAEER